MSKSVAAAAGTVIILATFHRGVAAQPAAPSSNDMINALTAPGARTGETSRGFRLNRGAAPPQQAAGGAAVRRQEATTRREIGVPLLFDIDQATLKPESAPMLASIAQALRSPQLAGAHILLEGHTDSSGSAEHNLVLSRQRAQAVKAALVQEGIDTARLSTTGKGQSEPANAANPLAAENRRVVLVNVSG